MIFFGCSNNNNNNIFAYHFKNGCVNTENLIRASNVDTISSSNDIFYSEKYKEQFVQNAKGFYNYVNINKNNSKLTF